MLNQLINVFWTFFGFMPVVWYWYERGAGLVLFVFIAISLAVGFLPSKWYRSLQLSNNRKLYEKLGIRLIRKFVQDGDVSNRLSGKRHIHISFIRGSKGIHNYLKTVSMYERYHTECLVFFLLSSLDGLIQGWFAMALIIMIANLVYNVFPILLQQYNRLRIQRLIQEI